MPFLRLREWQSVVLPLAIGFLLLIGVVAALAWFSAQRGMANAAVQRTLDIELRLSHILSRVQDAETGQRGFLLTADDTYLQPYEAARRAIASDIDELQTKIIRNSGQLTHLAALKKLIDEKFVELADSIEKRRSGSISDAVALVSEGGGKRLMDRIRSILAEMRAVQGGLLLAEQASVEAANTRLHLGTIVAFLLLIGVAGFALVKFQQQTLGLVTANRDLQSAHSKLVQESLQRERVEGQMRQAQKMDAIGQLTGGLAHDFNNMLAVIISALNLLKRRMGRGETNVGELVDAAIDGAQRAATLTHRLLAFSRHSPFRPSLSMPTSSLAAFQTCCAARWVKR